MSDTSVEKETVWLPQAYHAGGVREVWLCDPRLRPATFLIQRWTATGFVPVGSRVEGLLEPEWRDVAIDKHGVRVAAVPFVIDGVFGGLELRPEVANHATRKPRSHDTSRIAWAKLITRASGRPQRPISLLKGSPSARRPLSKCR